MQDIDYVLDFAVRLGKEMLVSGANLERVNIATELVCKHYGLNELTIRVMNTEVAVGAKNQAGDYCTRRINVPAAHIHLERLRLLNDLSRKVCRETPDVKELNALLDGVKAYTYATPVVLTGYLIAMASLARIFGGMWQDILVVLFNTVLLFFLTSSLSRASLNRIITNALSIFACGATAFAFYRIGLAQNFFIILITNAFFLIPGIPMVNAMRNILCGNEMNGILELLKVCLEVLTIVAGLGLFVFVAGNWFSIPENAVSPHAGLLYDAELVVLSFTASLGFSIVFQIHPKELVFAGLGGAITRIVYILLLKGTDYRIVFVTLAAFAAALYAEILATVKKTPATVYLYPSIIPLIPGDLIYYAMLGIIWQKPAAFESNAVDCLLSLVGISIGFVICSSLSHYIRTIKVKKLFHPHPHEKVKK